MCTEHALDFAFTSFLSKICSSLTFQPAKLRNWLYFVNKKDSIDQVCFKTFHFQD